MARTVRAILEVDSAGGVRSVKQVSDAMTDMERKAKTSVAAMSNSFNLLKASVLAVVSAAVLVGKSVIDIASDMQETQGKFDVVFRGLNDQAEGWSKTLQEGYAMSSLESKKYLSSIQDLLVPTGMAREAAGQLSFEFVKLAADLGSFNNRATPDVIEDFVSALLGGSETLGKFGINAKVAVVEQEALKLGLAKTTKEVTDADKAQALYSLSMKQSSDAVGDMARTSASYANQLKRLIANVDDFKILLGNELLPIVTEYVTQMNNWIKANKELIRQKVPEYIEKILNFLKATFDILSYDPMMTEVGLIGFVLLGRKGGLLLAGTVHTVNALKNTVIGLSKVMEGSMSFEEFAGSGYKELESKLNVMKDAEETAKNLKVTYKNGIPYMDIGTNEPKKKTSNSTNGFKFGNYGENDAPGGTGGGKTAKQLAAEAKKAYDEMVKRVDDDLNALDKSIQDRADAYADMYDRIDKDTLSSFDLQRKETEKYFNDNIALMKGNTDLEIKMKDWKVREFKRIQVEESTSNMEKLDETIAKYKEMEEASKTSLQKWAEDTTSWNDMITNVMSETTNSISTGLVDALFSFGDSSLSAGDQFKQFASDVLKAVAKMIIQFTILNAVKAGLSAWSGSGYSSGTAAAMSSTNLSQGTATAAILNGAAGAANGAVWQGGFQAFASGGKVTKPTLGLVGEGRYNEAIVPLPDGNSIPVQMKGGSGGSVNVTNNITIDKGAGGTDNEKASYANQIANQIKMQVVEIISQEKRYGGVLYSGAR